MKTGLFFMMILAMGCAVLQNNTVLYRRSKTLPDSAFVYALPFAPGTAHRVVQGYYSQFSHRGNFALDFKMKSGTGVVAARAGRVALVVDNHTTGGVGKKYVGMENSITIRHSDGTFGHYLHLRYKGALVHAGDTVQQGQQIGWSGSTGFSAFPHLHFEVTQGLPKAVAEIPVRFHTEKGAVFLQPLHRYKSI